MRFSFIAPLSPRCPVLLVVSVAVPPHIAREVFHPREAAIHRGGHIFRAVFLSSSHPPRLIVSSAPRIAVPSGRASRTAGGPRPGIVSPPRLVFAPSRPSCRRAGRKASRSCRPARLAVPVAPVPVAGQGIVVGSVPQSSRQASR